jgi:hypothetical protein
MTRQRYLQSLSPMSGPQTGICGILIFSFDFNFWLEWPDLRANCHMPLIVLHIYGPRNLDHMRVSSVRHM